MDQLSATEYVKYSVNSVSLVVCDLFESILHHSPTSLSFWVILDNVLELAAIPSLIMSSCFNRKPCANLKKSKLY